MAQGKAVLRIIAAHLEICPDCLLIPTWKCPALLQAINRALEVAPPLNRRSLEFIIGETDYPLTLECTDIQNQEYLEIRFEHRLRNTLRVHRDELELNRASADMLYEETRRVAEGFGRHFYDLAVAAYPNRAMREGLTLDEIRWIEIRRADQNLGKDTP